ncbi:hypothetical protein RB195_000251 [Necator americanus]|uniref:Uncharacterized protein n=1 Tax=Necator americanus TaxID=51031 RepID=A0ABR1DBS1_NECAM
MMSDGVGLGVNVSRRKRRSPVNDSKSFLNDYGSESDSSGDFIPSKRGRQLKKKPLRVFNSYDSIQFEVNKEKQRKTPARRPRTLKGRKNRDEEEEVEDPELKMSERMVDRIAALNDGKRTKVGITNCFEDRTALDCIDICLRESENMQEDAVALAIATAVYSLRVDRTHSDAQETRYTFIRGKSDAEKAMMLATDSTFENPKEKKKRRKVERDAERKKTMEASDPDSTEQPAWMKPLEPDTFDYSFGMKFPVQGTFLQHWDFTQDLLDQIENRRVEIRKAKRRKKLMSWKKIIPLRYCPFYTDFERATGKIESDRVDALAAFQARKGSTGKLIMLHDATTREPAPSSSYNNDVDLSVVIQSRDMLANCLREEPTAWDHYLLEDNPQLYKTGQYLRTGDMTGYVLQERPFYHHFDPDKESADDPQELYSCVEKNEDKTLYTFKKPPKGTALTRLAPLIRVPVNKYANPRNRKIEDFHFKESIVVSSAESDKEETDLKKLIEEVWNRLENQDFEQDELSQMNSEYASPTRKQGLDEENENDLEQLREELRQQSRSFSRKAVKECFEWTDCLNKAADIEQIEEDELVDWKTSKFLETVGPLKEKTFLETLKEKYPLDPPESEETNVIQRRTQIMASILGTSHNAIELRVPESTIFDEALYFIKHGIHKDLQYVDATYHMKIFKFRVTVEQAHESLRRAERIGIGKSPTELAALKQKCFRPGRYHGIRDSGQIPKSYQVDPWSVNETTLEFSSQFFRSRQYPRLEGALLQLHEDIKEAARKIPSDSWYYTAIDEHESDCDQKDTIARLNEAITLFTMRLNKAEDIELRGKRQLPKIVQRAVMQKASASETVFSASTSGCEPPITADEQPEPDATEEAEEQENYADEATAFCDDDGSDSGVPEDNACDDVADIAEVDVDEPLDTVEEPAQDTGDPPEEEESSSITSRKNKNSSEQMEEPPKKREKRIKSEPDVKLEETELEYFTKSTSHTAVSLRERFTIVDPRTLVRSEEVIFMRRKLHGRRLITAYKFEDFIKPGLLHKGRYPRMHMDLTDQDNHFDNIFNGIIRKSLAADEKCVDNADVDGAEKDVYDEWLATFGGFRFLYENDGFGIDESGEGQLEETALQDPVLSDNENINKGDDQNYHCSMNESATSFFSNDSITKRDRFYDIRPDEYKAIGIDVKNIVPNKDFYAMTKEERAAAVAAEFEAIDALGPKKEDGYVISIMDFSCRVSSYHLNTARMKRVMKSILSNPLLAYDKVLYTRRALLARRRAVERNKIKENSLTDPSELYYKKLDRSLDSSLGPLAEKILEEHNPMDITALDPIDVLEAVTYRNLEGMIDVEDMPNNGGGTSNTGVEESMRQFAAEVRQSDFKVQGLHTFSSVMQCLPRRMGNSGKYVNIANALAVTLYMCNENTLTLVQERTDTKDINESVNEGRTFPVSRALRSESGAMSECLNDAQDFNFHLEGTPSSKNEELPLHIQELEARPR